jgi:2-methylisocitrate lyase-like PEP mutase family enzyme
MENRIEQANALRRLHFTNTPLLLPNAWDALSARLFELAGFTAIATTSAGVAWAHGYPDGEALPRSLMLDTVARIAATVSVPVTADIEAGFGATPTEVGDTVRAVIAAGAVGINLEDGMHDGGGPRLRSQDEMVERLQAAREAADNAGVPVVINARTDLFLFGRGSEAERLAETVTRARAYLEAGADCIYPIGLTDRDMLAALVRELRAPVNVMAKPTTPDLAELARIGVARVSTAIAPVLAVIAAVQHLAETLQQGRFDTLSTPLTHADAQGLFGAH